MGGREGGGCVMRGGKYNIINPLRCDTVLFGRQVINVSGNFLPPSPWYEITCLWRQEAGTLTDTYQTARRCIPEDCMLKIRFYGES